MINVVVVDDDVLVTESLKIILTASPEIAVVGVANSGATGLAQYLTHRPDVLLMDIRMGAETGLDVAQQILAADPQAVILLLTTFSDDDYIRTALSLGVKGYLIKQNFSALVPAIKAVHSGQTVFDTEIVGKLSQFVAAQSNTTHPQNELKLNEREDQILRQVAQGKNNKEIAEALFLSEGTVRNYISQLLEKLALRDRTQLAIFYYDHYR